MRPRVTAKSADGGQALRVTSVVCCGPQPAAVVGDMGLQVMWLILVLILQSESRVIVKRSFKDQSVKSYLTERTRWWNEICKEEFQTLFRCRCPQWSYCRSPGRYYNAFCTMTGTGYIWTQPNRSWGDPVYSDVTSRVA
ncbi:uncharacterized protein LOC110837949 [Zootermopsis nevadensis]|uniref:uncharacterized protein LOC110837949 n=1 Tax=Zootermopsis nevadensis TaxID=136037 RepID=UPI000B8ED34B|nr:uncharacterized protein LOC110837949 [Zootermopsis nevadensis]